LKLKALCFLFIFFSFLNQLSAKGSSDSDIDAVTQNNEWVLCITEFDMSLLAADKIYIWSVASRELMEKFKAISNRTRVSPEYAYYEEYAWAKARAAAAKLLAAKMEERSRLIYTGEPDWKYKQNLKRVDTDIEKLRKTLDEVNSNVPLINNEPDFKLTSQNLSLSFPQAPVAGHEARFCVSQKADAVLLGKITEFHGRYVLTVKLYTLYNRAFIWEDNIIFSHDDINSALDELIKKLVIVLTGNRPAALAIKSDVEDTLLLVNRTFAGRGEAKLVEYPPGAVTVTASALNHETITFEAELKSGELTEINFKLNPIEYTNIDVTGDVSGNIYHGALYVGKAPLTLRLPVNNFEYLEMTAEKGSRGSIVFQTHETQESSQAMAIKSGIPVQKGKIDKERRAYYWAWGSQWITGIAAWISYYSYTEASRAYLSSRGNDRLFQEQQILEGVSIGTIIAFGAASAYGIYQMIRYIVISSKDETKLPKTGRVK